MRPLNFFKKLSRRSTGTRRAKLGRTRLLLEDLETRLTPSITLFAHHLFISGNDTVDSTVNDNISLSMNNGNLVVDLDGGVSTFVPAGIRSIAITPGAGTNRVIVNQSLGNMPVTVTSATVNGVRAQDSVFFGPDLSSFAAPVTVNGNGLDVVDLNNQPGAPDLVDQVTNSAVLWASFGGLNYSGLAALSIEGGTFQTVDSTAAGTAYTLSGGEIHLGDLTSSAGLSALAGHITVSASDEIDLTDQAASASQTYTFTCDGIHNFLTGTSFGGLTSFGQGRVLEFRADDTVNVFSTRLGSHLTVSRISEGAEPGQLNVGDGDLSHIRGPVAISGAGDDVLTLNDQTDLTSDTYTVTDRAVHRGAQDEFDLNYGAVGNLIVNGGTGGDTYTLIPLSGILYTFNGGSGNEVYNLSRSDLTAVVNGGGGNDAVTFSDADPDLITTYTLAGNTLRTTGDGPTPTLTYSSIESLTINGSGGGDTFIVAAPDAAAITLHGGSGSNALVGPNSNTSWNINGAGSGTLGSQVSFTAIRTVQGGSGNDSFNFIGPVGSIAGIVNGGGGTDALNYARALTPFAGSIAVNVQNRSASRTGGFLGIESFVGSTSAADSLTGPNADVNWVISGPGAGTAHSQSGGFSFARFENLRGGTGMDVFRFTSTGSLAGSLDGGAAPLHRGNWLDYSGLTTAVGVNIQTGAATSVGGSLSGRVINIQHVHGGDGGNTLIGNAQGNILIGGAGTDVLIGGSGRSILIGGAGADVLTGHSGSDILIGDGTSFDAMTTSNERALLSILAEWQSAHSYATRFQDINTGTGGLNGHNKLEFGTTVLDDGAADSVTGAIAIQAADWFFQGGGDTLHNVQTGEHIDNL
jgi:hypothetical protein